MNPHDSDTRLPPVSVLISPPEQKPFDSFSEPFATHKMSMSTKQDDRYNIADNTLPPIRSTPELTTLPSPPISPWPSMPKKTDARHVSPARSPYEARDPPLFSSAASIPFAADEPLFPPEPTDAELESTVTRHIANRQAGSDAAHPTRAEYLETLRFQCTVSRRCAADPHKWYKEEQRILQNHYPNIQRIGKPVPKARLPILAPAPANGGIRKLAGPSRQRVARAPNTNNPRPVKTARPQNIEAKAAKPKAATSREDIDFNALVNYAPPTEFLDRHPHALKVEWKGQMLDLTNDPHRGLLHDVEIRLASCLRLSCATYLCSKRRIFIGRVEALRIGKDFRKTDAQQACKIDVNKASKLWSVFDKATWFQREHFTHLFQ
ncbi:MAG: hypothetical protein M1814_000085 [Vezdaea aestivalis]|nr:MAG: hypothetical protein M1814_000085 [Vezdaea aestivalis]